MKSPSQAPQTKRTSSARSAANALTSVVLPDARLAADQHEAAVTGGRGVEMLAERGELGLALDQLHSYGCYAPP